MSKMVDDRLEVGSCDLGTVFLFRFAGTPVDGQYTSERFEVRAGNHTVLTTEDKAEAARVANALSGVAEEPPKAANKK